MQHWTRGEGGGGGGGGGGEGIFAKERGYVKFELMSQQVLFKIVHVMMVHFCVKLFVYSLNSSSHLCPNTFQVPQYFYLYSHKMALRWDTGM